MTLGKMLEKSAKRYPQKIAIIYKDLKIKYEALNALVDTLANSLIGLGIEKGDRIGLLLSRSPEMVISFLAVAKVGAIVVPLNFKLRSEELYAVLHNIKPAMLIAHSTFLPQIAELLSSICPSERIIVVGEEAGYPYRVWKEILQGGSSASPSTKTDPEDVVYFNYTSGTTGIPKAAITTHANMIWNTISAVETLKLKATDVHLCLFPAYAHPHELFARSIYLGGTLVLLDGMHPRSIAKAVADHRVTCLMAVPSFFEMLLPFTESAKYDLSSLRLLESGGMHTHVELLTQFQERFHIPLSPVWGSTETTGIALAAPVEGVHKPGSVGKPCLSYQAKVLDELGRELPANKVGEMIIKGPAVVKGYFDLPEETLKAFREGWYYTGDLFKRDEDGTFYFVGRKGGMMKVAGMKVYPQEVENVLYTHPKIFKAAVVSSKDRLRGEILKAVIVLKEGETATPQGIRRYCRERLATYKVPRVIEVRDHLPRMASGKIDLKSLA